MAAGAYFSATSARFAWQVLAKAEYVPAYPVRSGLEEMGQSTFHLVDLQNTRSLYKLTEYERNGKRR